MNKTQKLGEFLQGLLYKMIIFGATPQIGEKMEFFISIRDSCVC